MSDLQRWAIVGLCVLFLAASLYAHRIPLVARLWELLSGLVDDVWTWVLRHPWRIFLALLALVLLGVLTGCGRQDMRATVTKMTWYRAIPILEWQAVPHEGWDYPTGAYNITSERRYHHSERYICGSHTVTSGTGANRTTRTEYDYCSRSIYRDWYLYTHDEWTQVELREKQGDTHTPPVWPDDTDYKDCPPAPVPAFGCQQLGTRTSRYHVYATGANEKPYEFDVTEAIYHELDTGSKLTLQLGFFGDVQGLSQNMLGAVGAFR